jgi:adenylate cyclase
VGASARINGSGTFDPRERGWYRQAAGRSGVFWTGVYRFAGSARRGITAAVAVRDDAGALQAVVGVDIALDSLSDFLTGQRIARGGVALIVGPEQRLVAYPHEVAVAAGGGGDEALPPIESIQDDWILDAYRDVRAGRLRESANQSVEYTLTRSAGRHYLAHASAFPDDIGNDWELLVVVPEASLLEGARRLFSESAMVALILVLVAAIAVSLLSLKLFVPLRRLVRNTELIREFRFAEVQRVRSHYTEIQAMDQAIWQMSQGLRSLEKFVPADIGRQLIQSGKRAEPDAEVRELSLLFTGVAGLGALCDALPPERITALLAEQLDAFTAAILRCRGTIDNFLGESILAFWGVPVAMEDGPERACRA